MRKKLDTRFPAARIKKIMQADEEVGKIAMATPVLISKALELFLQDLCDQTYDITLKKGAKTMSSLHLKECVCSHTVFDFLREVVSCVPDIGSDTGGENGRRRKASDGENEDSCKAEPKRSRGEPHAVVSRCHGRGRGRGRGRGNIDRQRAEIGSEKIEDHAAISSPQLSDDLEAAAQTDTMETNLNEVQSSTVSKSLPKAFNVNMELDENGKVANVKKEVEQDIIFYHRQWTNVLDRDLQIGILQPNDDQNCLQPEDDYDCEDET